MSEATNPEHIAKKLVVYRVPGMDAVRVRRDERYGHGDSDALTMDLYYPADSRPGTRLPAIVIVTGFPGAGVEKVFGCTFKDMGSTTSWARLIAASGMIAIAYTNRDPLADVQALLDHVRRHASALDIDENRIGVWASSGNVPLALGLLMQAPLKCAVLCYGYTLDAGGSTGIGDAAKAWGFVNPAAGKAVGDLPRDLPLFIARAGLDTFAHLNEMLDRFVSDAVARNLPLTFANHPTGPHAFDLFDDSDRSRHIIEAILSFLRFSLLKYTKDTKDTKDTKAVDAP